MLFLPPSGARAVRCHRFARWASCLLCGIAGTLVHAAEADADAAADAPLALKATGALELGAGGHQLSAGYPSQQSVFVRWEFQPSAQQRWNGELSRSSAFDESGTLLALSWEQTLQERWLLQAGVAGSDAGIQLPRLRLDLGLGRKWLEQANLVTTLGLTHIDSRDAHSTDVLQLSAAYYFDTALGDLGAYAAALEGGVQHNTSQPGAVQANDFYAAVTLARPQQRSLSPRLGWGREAYQTLGEGAALVDFDSHSVLLTWREWLHRGRGLQLRLEHYGNPSYRSNGLELSGFLEF